MSLANLVKSLERGEILVPKLKAYLSAEAVKSEADPKHDHRMVILDAEMTMKAFKERMEEYNHRKKVEGQYFHPSALGVCLRQMWFGAVNAPADADPTGTELLRSHMILEIGTYYHVMVQNLIERAGLLVRREIPIQNKSAMLLGHGDGEVEIDKKRYLLEIKTINSRGFSQLREAKSEHKKQVMAYMRVLKLTACIIVYINKDTGQIKEFLILYDRIFYRTEVRRRVKKFFRHLRLKTVPVKEGAAPTYFPCTYCSFKRVCWDTVVLKKWMKKTGVTFPHETKKKKSLY